MLCRLTIFTDVSGNLTSCLAVQGHLDCLDCQNGVIKYYAKSSFNFYFILQKM